MFWCGLKRRRGRRRKEGEGGGGRRRWKTSDKGKMDCEVAMTESAQHPRPSERPRDRLAGHDYTVIALRPPHTTSSTHRPSVSTCLSLPRVPPSPAHFPSVESHRIASLPLTTRRRSGQKTIPGRKRREGKAQETTSTKAAGRRGHGRCKTDHCKTDHQTGSHSSLEVFAERPEIEKIPSWARRCRSSIGAP